MTRTSIIPCKLTSNGVVVGFWPARFVRSDDDLSGHWETTEEPPELIKKLWAANGYVELRRVVE